MVLNDEDCRRLLGLAQEGDRLAYRALLGSCRDWLARYYARRIAPQSVDDLIQETLMSLHAKRATYDPSRPFYPWLAAIARYRWIDALRKMTRDEELGEDDASVASRSISMSKSVMVIHFLPVPRASSARDAHSL